jgi:flavin-dependent dehydrogenase
MWMLDPDWAAVFPTDSGLNMYGCMPTKARLPEFREDPERAIRAFFEELPDGPPIGESRLVGHVLGKLEMPNMRRGPIGPGVALVGDAALATDPLWGVGCGWALQSGEWLADSVAPAVLGAEALERGLRRYRRRFNRWLLPHARVIHEYAGGRAYNAPERLLFAAAARDQRMAALFEEFGTRNISPPNFLLRALPRALIVNARRPPRRPSASAQTASMRLTS